ncbi:MAG: DUF721 domain-containing protein [Dysgonamonadaceae bacterium]|jgi:predicted nucleic acid-binding Zn ribbon protein|nr:DUF721 domain-containing protein [Dysgonamonadaceae bacterium]
MKRTDSQSIGAILRAFFQDNPRIADKLAEARLLDYWNNRMNRTVSKYTTETFIRNRVLYVKVTSSVLKNELMMNRQNLIEKLNAEAGRNVIDNFFLI